MKLIHKLTIGFLTIALLLAFVGTVNILYLMKIRDDVQRISESNIGEVQGSVNLAYRIAAINGDMAEYLLELSSEKKAASEARKTDILKSLDLLDESISELQASTELGKNLAEDEDEESDEEDEGEKIKELEATIREYKNLVQETFRTAGEQKPRHVADFYIQGNKSLEVDAKSGAFLLYIDAVKEIKEEVDEVNVSVDKATKLTVVIAVSAIFGALLIGFFTSKLITTRILKMKGALRYLKGGNFDIIIDQGRGNDEITELIETFNLMVGELKKTTASIDEMNIEIKRRQEAESNLQAAHDGLEAQVLQRTQQLETAKVEAESANRTKSEFLANMSHELRTPLNHIIGFTELIADEKFGPLNDIQKEYLHDSIGSSKHLLTLINDILDLSKVEAGKLDLNISEVNLQPLMKNCLVMFKEKAMKHQIELNLEEEGIPDSVSADEIKLKQIFFNLLSNAFNSTPDGGQIRLKAMGTEDVSGEVGDVPLLKFVVSDTGIGILAEDLGRIFKPFEQAGSHHAGTGLGLSLTKRFVELHGGEINVSSEGLDKGASFSFTLPALVAC